MRNLPIVPLLVLILVSGLFSNTWAQNNNNKIVFQEGWVTGFMPSVKYPRYARTEFPTDPVISRLLADKSIRPREMMEQGEDTLINWEAISADSSGSFKHELITKGGLYLEYHSPSEKLLIFDGVGHEKVYIHGVPREGDH